VNGLTIIAPAFYPTLHSVRYLDLSARRYGVPVTWYGLGEPYRGWLYTQVHRLITEIEKVETSHVLYTDASDALFLTGIEEIIEKCEAISTPEILVSREIDGQMCAGGWLADRYSALDALGWLADWTFRGDEENPQVRWREAIADREIEVMYDLDCHVFQVADEPLEVTSNRRVRNVRTGSFPCLWHAAGGYTDPVRGKADLIEPLWKELGYGH
jgi:hypothetical protein